MSYLQLAQSPSIGNEEKYKYTVVNICESIKIEIEEAPDNMLDTRTNYKTTELRILTDRILCIFDLTVEKLEIVFCLPHIFVDPMSSETDNIVRMCAETKLKISAMSSMSSELNEFQIVNRPEILNCINKMLIGNMGSLVPKHVHKLTKIEIAFLNLMRELKMLVEWRIIMTAPREIAKAKVLNDVTEENVQMNEQIQEINEKLHISQESLKKNIDLKNEIINRHAKNIQTINEQNALSITNEIVSSQQLMNENIKKYENIQNKSNELYEQTKNQYEIMMQMHLREEAIMRERKLEAQQRLQGWLNKYDIEIGEKNSLLIQINKQLNEENDKFIKFKIEFDAQEIVYQNVLIEKAAEEIRIRDERLLIFVMNRAATLLQRAWRTTLARRKKKKKGKGKGKGKK